MCEINEFYLCADCQNSYHINELAHFDANFYCFTCSQKRFFQYYHKKPLNANDTILAQSFALIYTNKCFKEELVKLLSNYL